MDKKTEKDTPAEVDEEALDQATGAGGGGKVIMQDIHFTKFAAEETPPASPTPQTEQK